MSALVGTGGLIRLILRRDRFLLPAWIVIPGLLPLLYASATDELYPTAEGLREYYASIVNNPSMMSTIGPVFDANLGALTTWRAGLLGIFVGVFSLLTVIRHTRAEEDAGRRELVGSTVVSRQAPLLAALVVTCAANLVMGAIVTLGLIGYGLPTTGSVALGLSMAAAGWMFTAVGGVAAQLTEGAGAARGIAFAFLGGAFALRAVGDAGGVSGDTEWLSWLSPLGWVHRVEPFAGERWWAFGLMAGFFVVLAAVAAALLGRRDVGAGIMPPRLGRAEATGSFGSSFALAWRLHRGLLLGWTVGFAALGLVVGGATQSLDQLVEGSSQLATMLTRLGGVAALRDTYISVTMGMLALAATGYGIQAALRMRAEETAMRVEPVLATAVPRLHWLASHLVFALVGPAVTLAMLGLCTGLVTGAAAGDVAGEAPRVLAGALVQLPAVWVITGIAVALFGLLPRLAAGVSWGALLVCVLLSFVGPLLQLDQQVLDVSPFAHVPKVPGGDVSASPLLWLSAIALALVVAGLGGFRRRDIG